MSVWTRVEHFLREAAGPHPCPPHPSPRPTPTPAPLSCTRYYFLEWYYKMLKRAGVSLADPAWNGPIVPSLNETHDTLVTLVHRKQLKAAGEHVRVW